MSSEPFVRSGVYPPEERAGSSAQRPSGRFLDRYQTIVLWLAMAAIYSNLAIYGFVLNSSLLPKYTFFLVFFLTAPLLLLKSPALGAYLMSPFVVWATALLVLNLIHLAALAATNDFGGIHLTDSRLEARVSLVLTRAQYILFAVILGFAAYTSTRKTYLYAFVFLMVLLPCAVIYDFAHPGDLYPIDTEGAVLGRAGAMFINPTMAGEAILHVFLLGCALTKNKYRLPLYLVSGAGILLTFSRSSIIAWLLIFVILVYRRSLPKSAVITMAMVLGVSVVLLGSFESYLNSRQELDAASSNILARLNFFSSYSFNDDSSEERADVIRAGWDLFLGNPVFGGGAGATLFWSQRGSTHNQVLLFAAEYGVIGIGMWVWLLAILWKGRFFEDRGLQLAMVFLFAFMSLFTHQMLDSSFFWLTTFALISVRKNRLDIASSEGMRNYNGQESSPR
jgi:O-antigen ligase